MKDRSYLTMTAECSPADGSSMTGGALHAPFAIRHWNERLTVFVHRLSVSVSGWFLRWRDYHRTLNELECFTERDLRELRINKADFVAIAWDEAARRHELRRGSVSRASLRG